MSAAETTESNKVNPPRPPEILCQIFQSAVGSDGIKALLPLTHVCVRWRRVAIGDPFLWTTIHLSQTSIPLLDLVLTRARGQFFTVYVDHRDPDRILKICEIVDRIEELHYSSIIQPLPLFLEFIGPAPNLKALHLRPESVVKSGEPMLGIKLPIIFSGFLPSLRNLTLTSTVTWPIGLFRGLTSFECGTSDQFPIPPIHVLDVLQESPKIEVLRLTGHCKLPQPFDPPAVALPSLRQCSLIGDGTTSLIRFITVPASTTVFLRRRYSLDSNPLPTFNSLSEASGIRVLNDISAISFSIHDHMVRLQVNNTYGGVLDAEEHGIGDFSQDPPTFVYFLGSFFECGNTCPGFTTTKKFTLHVERGGIWEDPRAVGFFCVILTKLIFVLRNVEQMEFSGLPSKELTFVFAFLSSSGPNTRHSSPNLKQLHFETTPLHSPEPLLKVLDQLFRKRKELGAPLQSVKVKVKCEILIPAATHCTLLSSWEGLVEEGVLMEYEQAKVEELPRYRNWDREDEGDYERDHEEEDEETHTGDPGYGCVGWDG